MPRRRHRAILPLLGTAALLGGCGDGDGHPVHDRDAVLHLRLEEYRIRPQALTVTATDVPTRVRIVARNAGRLTHNVRVEQELTDDSAPPIVYGGTPTAQPGATVQADVELLPGRYRLVDTIANHENLGGYGELTVEQPDR